jgi:hypothetical protein
MLAFANAMVEEAVGAVGAAEAEEEEAEVGEAERCSSDLDRCWIVSDAYRG